MKWMLLIALVAAVVSLAGCENNPFRRGMYCAPPVYSQPTYAPPTYTAPPPQCAPAQCAPACMPVVPACTCN